jgi:hypothetical protein
LSVPGGGGLPNAYLIDPGHASDIWQVDVTADALGNSIVVSAICAQPSLDCPGQLIALNITNPGSCSSNGTLTISAPANSFGEQATGTYACAGGVLSTVTLTNVGTQYQGTSPTIGFSGTCTGCAVTATINGSGTGSIGTDIGSQVLEMFPGDRWAVVCPNTPDLTLPVTLSGGIYVLSGTGTPVIAPNAPWTGSWSSANTTATLAWNVSGSAGLVDNSGYCEIYNNTASLIGESFEHETEVTDGTYAFTTGGQLGVVGGAPSRHNSFAVRNSIVSTGTTTGDALWHLTGITVGEPSFSYMVDTNTSTYASYVIFDKTGGYTATGSSVAFPVSSPALFSPTLPYCTGSPGNTQACIGFVGSEYANTSTWTVFPPNPLDLNLLSASYYYAGHSGQATDGSSQGANVLNIFNAELANTYPGCGTVVNCGSNTPFPDSLGPSITPPATSVSRSGSMLSDLVPLPRWHRNFPMRSLAPFVRGSETENVSLW